MAGSHSASLTQLVVQQAEPDALDPFFESACEDRYLQHHGEKPGKEDFAFEAVASSLVPAELISNQLSPLPDVFAAGTRLAAIDGSYIWAAATSGALL